MLPAYTAPLPIPRPHGSFRIDVFSPKANRRMTLYGKPALCQLVELEADCEVTAICERPIVILDLKPKRVVDFWSMKGQVPTYHLLLRPSEDTEQAKSRDAYVAFKRWVADEHGRLEELAIDRFEEQRTRLENWIGIMRDIGLHKRLVTPAVLERCAEVLPDRFTLMEAQVLLGDLEEMVSRAAIFTLLSRGNVTCPMIDKQHLQPRTEFVRV